MTFLDTDPLTLFNHNDKSKSLSAVGVEDGSAAVRVEDPARTGLGQEVGTLLGGHLPRLYPFHDTLGELRGNQSVAAHRRDLQNMVFGEENLLPVKAKGEEGRMWFEINLFGQFDDFIDQTADDDRDPRVRLFELFQN